MKGMVLVRRNPAVSKREIKGGEGALLLNRGTDAYHRLNRTGALIWDALAEPASLEEIERRVRGLIDAGSEDFAADVAAYVDELASRDLVLLAGDEIP